MGCNCKQVKKIEKKLPSIKYGEYEKKGWIKFFEIIKKTLWKLLGFCIAFIFTIIAIPVIAIMALISFTVKGEMILSLPFLKNQKDKEMIAQIIDEKK